MRHRVLSYGFIALLSVLAAGCGASGSSAPTAPTNMPAAAAPQPPEGITATYGTPITASQYPISAYTVASRLTFYDDGRFALEMQGGPYGGSYTRSGDQVTFAWDGWSTAGPWGATGTVAGDHLTIHYNLVMQLTDFEDATYTRIQ